MTRQTKLLIVITAAICMIMFAAGLKPKGFRLHNTASWLTQTNPAELDKSLYAGIIYAKSAYNSATVTNGISFGKMGIAYTDNNHSPVPESLSIELAIKPPKQSRKHLEVIFDLWDSRSQSHTVLCQWDSTLMVMKSPSRFFINSRLHLGKSVNPKKVSFVTITSRRNLGTDLYINGIHARSTRRFNLCDSSASLGRLILGNSAGAQNPWDGELYSLSLYRTAFSKEEVLVRYHQWAAKQPIKDSSSALASYSFNERSGEIAHDRGEKFGDLHIPSVFSIPQKQILSMPWDDFKFDKSYAFDIAMNLFGFIPFGIFFSALLWSINGFARRHRLILSVLAGMGISLFFELTQAYIPTRSSQMSDVILNVLGTVAGAMMPGIQKKR
jgi:hypothetical protein